MKRAGRAVSASPGLRGTETLECLALTLASGLLLGLPFLWPALSWLHWVALTPWALLLTAEHRRKTWLYFFLGIYLSFAMAFGPFSALHKVVPFWAALVLAPLMIPFAIVVRTAYLRVGAPLVLVVPLAWAAAEWLRLRFTVGQVGLFPLAASQFRLTTLIQIADLAGATGVSFVVAAGSGALADLWVRRRYGLRSLAAFALLLVAVLGYGSLRLGSLGALRFGPRIAVVQPNEVHYRDPAKVRSLLDRQLELAREAAPPGAVDLVALPENTVDFPFGEDPYFRHELQRLARERDATVLAGAFTWATPEKRHLYTSGYYFDRNGGLVGRYDKLHLIPWAEYLPFQDWLPRWLPLLARWHAGLSELVLGYSDPGRPGETLVLFDLESESGTYRFAAPICYEVANPIFARRAALAGADFLVNISSEGFFGAPLYHHMWALSTLRAVETRRPVVRVSNNGISGLIDPSGRTRDILRGRETGRPYLDSGFLVGRPALLTRPAAPFVRLGDLFSYSCAAGSFALLLAPLVVRIRSRAARDLGRSSRP